MQDNQSFPIHLPDGFQVSVSPDKQYGQLSGKELIERYGKKRIRKLGIESTGNRLFVPSGLLKNRIKVNGNTYNTRKYFNRLEELTGKQILCRKELRAKKYWQNVTLILPESLTF